MVSIFTYCCSAVCQVNTDYSIGAAATSRKLQEDRKGSYKARAGFKELESEQNMDKVCNRPVPWKKNQVPETTQAWERGHGREAFTWQEAAWWQKCTSEENKWLHYSGHTAWPCVWPLNTLEKLRTKNLLLLKRDVSNKQEDLLKVVHIEEHSHNFGDNFSFFI